MKTKRTNKRKAQITKNEKVTKTKQTFKWEHTCAHQKKVNLWRLGMQGSEVRAGRTLTGQGDSAYFRSRCRKLVRPTEKFKKSNCLL